MSDDTQHNERRPSDAITAECMTILMRSMTALHEKIDAFNDLREGQDAMRRELAEHIADEAKNFARAFPDGDPEGHRRAHEARIREAEEKAAFWRSMRIKAGEMTVYAFLLALVAIAGYYWNGHMPVSAQLNVPGAGK